MNRAGGACSYCVRYNVMEDRPSWAFPDWSIYGLADEWTGSRWMLGFNAPVGGLVWDMQLCHGSWEHGPRVTVTTTNLPAQRAPHQHSSYASNRSPTRDNAIFDAVLAVTPPLHQAGVNPAELEELVNGVQTWPTIELLVDRVPLPFFHRTIAGEEVAISDLLGDHTISVAGRDCNLAAYALSVIDPAAYRLDPSASLPPDPPM
jgi:hypothetical protein